GEGERRVPVMKLAEGKVTWPGAKQVFRVCDEQGRLTRDVIELADAAPPQGARVEPLLVPVMREGEIVRSASLDEARARCAQGLASLPSELLQLRGSASAPTEIGPAL